MGAEQKRVTSSPNTHFPSPFLIRLLLLAYLACLEEEGCERGRGVGCFCLATIFFRHPPPFSYLPHSFFFAPFSFPHSPHSSIQSTNCEEFLGALRLISARTNCLPSISRIFSEENLNFLFFFRNVQLSSIGFLPLLLSFFSVTCL